MDFVFDRVARGSYDQALGDFIGKAMLTWEYRNKVAWKLIEPGKPTQNAYVESFSGRNA